MKIYNLYHYPSSRNFFFLCNPSKFITVSQLAKLITDKTDCYPEGPMEDFTDWFVKKNGEDKLEAFELSSPRNYRKVYFGWLQDNVSMKKFLDYENICITQERVIE